MELLYKHEQQKIEAKKELQSTCSLMLCEDHINLYLNCEFYMEYLRRKLVGAPRLYKNAFTFTHALTINKHNGDIHVKYNIINSKSNMTKLYRNTVWDKKNDFMSLFDLTEHAFHQGEKKQKNFWGLKYKKARTELFEIIYDKLMVNMVEVEERIKNKDYFNEDIAYLNNLYDLIVDFHCFKKGIKAHDDIYGDLLYEYPKTKWLKKNDYKYIPSVLDSYGIKSKYLIGELNTRPISQSIDMRSVNFVCKLFGENYIDYLRKFDWRTICNERINNRNVHTLKNEIEKDAMVKLLNSWDDAEHFSIFDAKLKTINTILTTREFIESRGVEAKLTAKNPRQLLDLSERWDITKKHFKLGYKIKYNIPEEIINDIQETIVCNGETFQPIVITSEELFKIEGALMKNCMAGQFSLGSYYMYIAISCGRKRVNVQFRKGKLVQARGKANIDLPEDFIEAVDILSKKLLKYQELTWKREKYDIITN
jgi:hypothetical protein